MNVCVIIPVYNEQDFIKKSIESIVSQTTKPQKVIYVNDSSTDETRNIIKEFSDKHEWIDLIDLEIHETLTRYNFKIFSCERINNLSGLGVNSLRSNIISHAQLISINKSSQFFKMNIDRSFIKKGCPGALTSKINFEPRLYTKSGSKLFTSPAESLPIIL